MKRSKTLKRIWSLLLTLAMVLTMGITAMPSYAEGEASGNGKAVVTYKAAKDENFSTTLTLYKVGHFARYTEADAEKGLIPQGSKVGDSYLAFDEGLPDSVNINIKRKPDETEEAWIEEWQEAAASYANILDPATVTEKHTADVIDGVAEFGGLANGLYLMTGPRVAVEDKDHEVFVYYTPNPSFIMVLNGTAEFEVKPLVETIRKYSITKAWADQGHEALRPTSVDVELYRRDSREEYASDDEGWKLVETITLSEKVSEKYPTPWTYAWESEAYYQWKWKEVMGDDAVIHYIVTETDRMGTEVDEDGEAVNNDNVKHVTLTNTYTKRQLELTKILDQFLENGDNSATFVFEIRGFIGDKQVYTGSAGINFAKDATGTLKKLVDNIPVNLTRLEVEEVYSGNYEEADGKDARIKNAVLVDRGDDNPPIYTVSFENEFKNDITIKGGIVNTYTNEAGKIVLKDKDYGKTPAGGQVQ